MYLLYDTLCNYKELTKTNGFTLQKGHTTNNNRGSYNTCTIYVTNQPKYVSSCLLKIFRT